MAKRRASKRQPAPPKRTIIYDRLGPNRVEVKAGRPLVFCLGDQMLEVKITEHGFRLRTPMGVLMIAPETANIVYVTNPCFKP